MISRDKLNIIETLFKNVLHNTVHNLVIKYNIEKFIFNLTIILKIID